MQELSREFIAKAYTIVKRGKYTNKYLNKDVVREVLKIKQPKIKLPKEMPANIQAFNDRIDNLFVKHDKKVRKVLAKY